MSVKNYWCLNIGQKMKSNPVFIRKKIISVDYRNQLIYWEKKKNIPRILYKLNFEPFFIHEYKDILYSLSKQGFFYKLDLSGKIVKIVLNNLGEISCYKRTSEFISFEEILVILSNQ